MPEFYALHRQWQRGHGIKAPLTREQRENLQRNELHIVEKQIAARERVRVKREKKLAALGGRNA